MVEDRAAIYIHPYHDVLFPTACNDSCCCRARLDARLNWANMARAPWHHDRLTKWKISLTVNPLPSSTAEYRRLGLLVDGRK
jgi:hypothetical protein